jgi:hypothetical protein
LTDQLDIAALYLHSPTLEYNRAFNLAILGWECRDEPVLAVMSSAVHAIELLKRCQTPLHISGTGAFDATHFVSQAQGWAWGPIQALSLNATGQSYTSIVWAEPEAASAEEVIRSFGKSAATGAHLRAISASLLRNFLPAWQTAPYPAREPLLPGKVIRLLHATGWKVSNQITFHGPRSILWSLFSRAAGWVGRPDWADRCLFAMRRTYCEPGWLWPAAPLVLTDALYMG